MIIIFHLHSNLLNISLFYFVIILILLEMLLLDYNVVIGLSCVLNTFNFVNKPNSVGIYLILLS